ncbi:MAG: cobyrinic acid a,c-diamide synthase, partial [Pseudanabaena sp.]
IIERLEHLGKKCFDWEKLLPLMSISHPQLLSHNEMGVTLTSSLLRERGMGGEDIRIAIARDRAFSFYYADNLDLFREMGAELVPWSPISDHQLPENIQGLYFGGGFPEVFAAELSENKTARESVHKAIISGIPTYAECGGLMYLCDRIVNFEDQSFPMVNILPTTAKMGKRLTLGYRKAIALQDSP